jgi:hypothetical protein
MPTFADRVVSYVQHGGIPTAVNLNFLDRSRYFSSKWLLSYPREVESSLFHTLLLRKSDNSGESNLGPLGLQPETLSTRQQRRPHKHIRKRNICDRSEVCVRRILPVGSPCRQLSSLRLSLSIGSADSLSAVPGPCEVGYWF